jgi:putative membrane protein
MKSIPTLLVALTALAGTAVAQDNPPPRAANENQPGKTVPDDAALKPATESDFIMTAAKFGMVDAKLAELASGKAKDEKVKELAETLLRDHTAANTELKALAKAQNVTIPDRIDADADTKHRNLGNLTGEAFDKAFIDAMAGCHEKSITLYEAGRKVAKSSEVTAFIDKTLPVLRRHEEKIRALNPGGGIRPGTPPGEPRQPQTSPQPAPGTNPK